MLNTTTAEVGGELEARRSVEELINKDQIKRRTDVARMSRRPVSSV